MHRCVEGASRYVDLWGAYTQFTLSSIAPHWQGVNSWDAMFPAIRDYLGLPSNATVVPFNLINATVAYAVSDIVW